MAKFLNKKEQVIDIQLTPYGRHQLSMGEFKPEYYAFFDNNIIYDGKYAGITETQNEIGQRIKRDTQYLESMVLFEDLGELLHKTNEEMVSTEAENYFQVDVSPIQITPKKDAYRYTSIIGDAHLDGEQQSAPAWKIVLLNGTRVSSFEQDDKNDIKIPQVNIRLDYQKRIADATTKYDDLKEQDFRKVIAQTDVFSDGKVIEFVSDDLMVYIEELNTDMLTENFEIEVFEIAKDAATLRDDRTQKKDEFRRKYFKTDHQRIMGGLMTEKSITDVDRHQDDIRDIVFNYTTSSVGYYFDFLKDYEIDAKEACRGAQIYNNESYYIDLDFDCSNISNNNNYNVDLYGPVTEPEICP